MLGKNIYDMKMHPKIAWDNMKILREGFSGHHVEKKTIKFRNKEGVIRTNYKDSSKIAADFFSEVFNRDAVVCWPHVSEAPQRLIILCM